MSLILVLSLQAAAVATPAASAPPPASRPGWALVDPRLRQFGPDLGAFDLAGIRSGGCRGAAEAEVLVCAPRRGRGDYPLDYWDRVFGPEGPIRAEMNLGGGVQGRVYTDAVPMDRGAVSNRVLVGIKLPF